MSRAKSARVGHASQELPALSQKNLPFTKRLFTCCIERTHSNHNWQREKNQARRVFWSVHIEYQVSTLFHWVNIPLESWTRIIPCLSPRVASIYKRILWTVLVWTETYERLCIHVRSSLFHPLGCFCVPDTRQVSWQRIHHKCEGQKLSFVLGASRLDALLSEDQKQTEYLFTETKKQQFYFLRRKMRCLSLSPHRPRL